MQNQKIKQSYPSITRLSYRAGLSHTGQFQVGLRSFICRNKDASKHCKWPQVCGLQGVVMRILPNGHISETRKLVVAISQSPSSLSFSLTKITKYSECVTPKLKPKTYLKRVCGRRVWRLFSADAATNLMTSVYALERPSLHNLGHSPPPKIP